MELELYTRISATASVVKEPHNTELMKHLRQFLRQIKRLFSQIWSEIGTIKIKNRRLVWVLTGVSNDPNKTSYFVLLFVTTPGIIILIMICLRSVVDNKLLN